MEVRYQEQDVETSSNKIPLRHGTARAARLRKDITLRMPDAQASAADNTLQKYGIFPKSQKNRTKKCLRTPKKHEMTSIKAIEAAASAQRVERKSREVPNPLDASHKIVSSCRLQSSARVKSVRVDDCSRQLQRNPFGLSLAVVSSNEIRSGCRLSSSAPTKSVRAADRRRQLQ